MCFIYYIQVYIFTILQKVIEYDKDNADTKLIIQRTRPRVFKYPQISLDDVSDDKRDMVCTFVYSTSKTMSELTSGVPEARPITVDIPSKPFGHLVKYYDILNYIFNLFSLYNIIIKQIIVIIIKIARGNNFL